MKLKLLILYSIFIAVLIFIVYIHLAFSIPGLDAGLHMYGALLLTKGHSPYADLWNNKPPLIYILGTCGFILKSNPFLGARIFEILVFFIDIFLIARIVKITRLGNSVFHLLAFCILYLVSWDQGFLTETFSIPIVLVAIWLLLKKTKYYEFICGSLIVLSFLLKQNAPAIIAAIILLDIFSDYRQPNKIQKAGRYIIAVAANSAILFFILYHLSIWPEFLDQVFIYNTTYASRPPLSGLVENHLLHNSFLSIKGVSAIMVLNICVFIIVLRYGLLYKKGYSFTIHDKVLSAISFVYLFSYPFVYISGKSYPHYFMLLIVFASLILGYYAGKTIVVKLALLAILIVGLTKNISGIMYYEKQYHNTKALAGFLKENSRENEFIHIVGLGNQYIYVMADRLSNTKFLLPLFESTGYSESYKKIITKDFFEHSPTFLIFNKISHWHPGPDDFYMQTINRALKKYTPVFGNEQYEVFKLSQQ